MATNDLELLILLSPQENMSEKNKDKTTTWGLAGIQLRV